MAKKKKKEEQRPDSFTGLFLALTIILFAFFIMLNSIAEIESTKARSALRSFQVSRAGMGIIGQGVSINDKSTSVGGKKSSAIKLEAMHDKIQQSLAKWGEGKDFVKVFEDERRLLISLEETAMFGVGEDTLHPRVFGFLDKMGELIKQIQVPVTVQGHSDIKGSGKGPSNWVLSAGRAAEVVRYLTEGVNVSHNLVEAESFADTRPIASNKTREGRAKNRRVDLVFYKRNIKKAQESQ